MSKATPEEAKALAAKYNLRISDYDCYQLAALIDEVRWVDAEPVGYICPARLKNLQAGRELSIPMVYKSEALLDGGAGYLQDIPVYTHPAPSQPAAPVAEVRTSLKKCVADAKETSGAYWKAYAESLAEDFDALATQYLALKNVAPVELPVVADGMKLTVIRHWPEGFEDRLQLVWLDVVSFIPNVKLYDLQRVLAEFGFRMEVYEDAQAAIAAAQSQPAPPEIMTLHNRIAELTAQHGSLRAAAAVINIDVGYLSRLASDEKVKPGKEFLRRMGLRAFTTYERIK